MRTLDWDSFWDPTFGFCTEIFWAPGVCAMPVRLVMSPSERAAQAKAKAKAKAAKKYGSPGPGAYDYRSSLNNAKGASASFNSDSKRAGFSNGRKD